MDCPSNPEPPLPLLITGISGVAGYNAFLSFRRLYPGRVIGVRPPRTWQLTGHGVVGLDTEDRGGIEELFRTHRFRAARPATLYFDEVRSCTYVADLNRVFAHFLSRPLAGLFHAGGPRPITLYQIAQVVNRVGGYEPHLLNGCPRRDAGPVPPRA